MAVPYDALEQHLQMNQTGAPPPRIKTSKYFITLSPNKRFAPNSPEAKAYISKLEAAYDEVFGSPDKLMQYVIILRSQRVPETDETAIEEERQKISCISGSRMGEQGMINNIVHLHALLSFTHQTLIQIDYGRLRADFAKAIGEISIHFYSHVFSDKSGTILDYIQKRIDYISKGDMKQFSWLRQDAAALQATIPHNPVAKITPVQQVVPPPHTNTSNGGSSEEDVPIAPKRTIARQPSQRQKEVPYLLQGVVEPPPAADKPRTLARSLPPMKSTASSKPRSTPAKKMQLPNVLKKMKAGEKLSRAEKAAMMKAMMSDSESDTESVESESEEEPPKEKKSPPKEKESMKYTRKNPPPGKVWSSFFGDFIDIE
jgi:hypothetical protein